MESRECYEGDGIDSKSVNDSALEGVDELQRNLHVLTACDFDQCGFRSYTLSQDSKTIRAASNFSSQALSSWPLLSFSFGRILSRSFQGCPFHCRFFVGLHVFLCPSMLLCLHEY